MTEPLRSERLATGPFMLIETPAYAQKSSKPHDRLIEAASVMALGHNVIIRGLNSIYMQAPHVIPSEYSDFISYATCWAEVLNHHHDMEEKTLFPEIERRTGEKGIMEANVEQHHAFLPGLQAYSEYLSTSSSTPASFSGTHLNSIIDSFAPNLIEHLADEIPTLLSLSRFGSELPLLDMINLESKKTPMFISMTGGMSFFFRNLDLDFEGGMWREWPHMPGFVWWFMQNTFAKWNQNWWKYASCDQDGKLKELPALKEGA